MLSRVQRPPPGASRQGRGCFDAPRSPCAEFYEARREPEGPEDLDEIVRTELRALGCVPQQIADFGQSIEETVLPMTEYRFLGGRGTTQQITLRRTIDVAPDEFVTAALRVHTASLSSDQLLTLVFQRASLSPEEPGAIFTTTVDETSFPVDAATTAPTVILGDIRLDVPAELRLVVRARQSSTVETVMSATISSLIVRRGRARLRALPKRV